VVRFGLPAILAAVAGASLLGLFAALEPLAVYHLAGREAVVTPVKLAMGGLMFAFAVFELLPVLRDFRFRRRHLVLGGLLSGFFGGLSGHQGALRSAFLVKSGLDTQSFVGTSAVIGLMVDATRLATYFVLLTVAGRVIAIERSEWPLVAVGCVAAFTGVLVGKRWLHKVTIGAVQALTGILLLLVALLLGSGLI
jgi:uncharacterized membrane protein YfcA